MSDKAQAPANEKAQSKPQKNANAKGKETKADVVKSENAAKASGPKWTLARCQKYARRFASESQWAAGAPSSYKSAAAHGWLDQCLAVMGGKVIAGNFRPQTDAHQKRAA